MKTLSAVIGQYQNQSKFQNQSYSSQQAGKIHVNIFEKNVIEQRVPWQGRRAIPLAGLEFVLCAPAPPMLSGVEGPVAVLLAWRASFLYLLYYVGVGGAWASAAASERVSVWG